MAAIRFVQLPCKKNTFKYFSRLQYASFPCHHIGIEVWVTIPVFSIKGTICNLLALHDSQYMFSGFCHWN